MSDSFDYSWDWEDGGSASGTIKCICGKKFRGSVSDYSDSTVKCPQCNREYRGKWIGMQLELVGNDS